MREVPLNDEGEPVDSEDGVDMEPGDKVMYRHRGQEWTGTVLKVQRRVIVVEPDVHTNLANVPKKDIIGVA